MIPDIHVAVDFAIAQSGKPYHAYGERFGPAYYDCSGLVVTSLRLAGVDVPSNVGNTVGLYYWAKRVGGLVSVDKASRTKGALLIKGRWYGYGPLGHVEFSLGDGREVGAHSSRSGIGIRPSDASRYQDGFIIPNVNYHFGPPPPLPPPLAPEIKEYDMVILPGTPRPESRIRWAILASSGEWIWLFDGGKVLGMDDRHQGDPAERRRWYPKNADGSNAGTAANPLIGLTKDAKYLIAGRLDGGIYRGEIDAS